MALSSVPSKRSATFLLLRTKKCWQDPSSVSAGPPNAVQGLRLFLGTLSLFPSSASSTSPWRPWRPNPCEGPSLPLAPRCSLSLVKAAGDSCAFPQAAASSAVRTPVLLALPCLPLWDATLDSLAKFFHLNFIFYYLTSWGFLYPNRLLTCS